MSSWNVVVGPDDEQFLTNESRTRVVVSPSSKPDLGRIMSELELAGVPIGYSRFLEEIRFTRIRDSGDYHENIIRICASQDNLELASRVITHELAHHVDDWEDIVSDERLIKEKKKRAKYMTDRYARKSVGEYLAVGFEVYYFGDREERRRMKKKNPILFKTIRNLHRKYKDI